jgi:hypothetical protein
MSDVRALDLCSKGARAWCALHRLDWDTFLREGLPCSALEAKGDYFGTRVAQHARERQA